MQKIFKGIMPALITPLHADRRTVNEEAARALAEFHLSQGADGFYILGSTGEGLLIPEKERMKMCEIIVSQAAGRKPVICHIAAMNMDEAVRLAKHAQRAGADAVSAIPPIFFQYTEEDIYHYYKTLAQSTDLPFIIYNHSAANGGMSAAAVARLFGIDNVTGVKWTISNYYEMMKLKELTHGEMNIINGPDETLLAGLASGADAGIGTNYNVMLPQFLEIYRCFKEGRMEEALRLQTKVNRVIGCVLKHEAIPAVKAMCAMLGFDAGDAAAPQCRMTEEKIEALKRDLAASGWPFGKDS